MFAQGASLSGQFAQQSKLRMMAQETASKEVASSELRRQPAYSKSPNCADATTGGAALFYKSARKRSAPRRGGPAKIAETDETGATAKFQSQTFKVARYYAR